MTHSHCLWMSPFPLIYLSIYLSTYLSSIYLSTYHLSIYLSIYLSTFAVGIALLSTTHEKYCLAPVSQLSSYLSGLGLHFLLRHLKVSSSSSSSFFSLFYWSVVELQCFVNFCYTEKWFSYTYIFFFIFFLLWFITGYWIQFPVLHSRTLLFIHSIYWRYRLDATALVIEFFFSLSSVPDLVRIHDSSIKSLGEFCHNRMWMANSQSRSWGRMDRHQYSLKPMPRPMESWISEMSWSSKIWEVSKVWRSRQE